MHRQIITITGEQSASLTTAKRLTKNVSTVVVHSHKEAQTFLGQEFDAVIIDLHPTFDANAFGAITGTIRGGGFLVLLVPDQLLNGRFLQRFYSILLNSSALKQQIQAGETVEPLPFLENIKLTASDDQTKAVEAILHVVAGHRRRPLLITADRGRGKSAALGIAAARLLQTTCQHICICAPSKKTAEIVFQHARANHTDIVDGLTFYSVDELLQEGIKTDLLLVDEAASIPLNRLNKLLTKYSRIVFATTEHGYEGSGRGFATRFRKMLDNETSNWQHCPLETPIRWEKNDPLEKFTFDALLLNAEYIHPHKYIDSPLNECNISCLDKDELIKNELKLKQLFALLVAAHYQTKPSDLHYLLDDDSVSIFVMENNQHHIIATALVAREGELDQQIASQIYQGIRRPKGNLVAQALSSSMGIEYAPCLKGDRIVRIAVHPDYQGNGLGTALLKFITQQSTADYISSSFGATPEVLSFWKQSDFVPVNVGLKRDASSGSHSVIVLKANNKQGEALLEQAQQRFYQHFIHLLADSLNNLETDLSLLLLCSDPSLHISDAENKEINAFATQQRSYENSIYPIWKLVCRYLTSSQQRNKQPSQQLSKNEQTIIVLKVLQKHSWQTITKRMLPEITGKKMAIALLRKAILSLGKCIK